MKWDPAAAAEHFGAHAESEWRRFESGRSAPSALATHTHYLRELVHPGDRVLDAGSGPGRFAIELARIGARVVLADISPEQLDLSREKIGGAGLEGQVEDRVVADVTDLSIFESGSFDATVCYGGAISYVGDRAGEAVAELARVTKSGGILLVSVMCTTGATLTFVDDLLTIAREDGIERARDIVSAGNLPRPWGHYDLKMYRWSELRTLLDAHGEIVAAAATGMFRAAPEEPELRQLLDEIELDLGAEPGAIDTGLHILAAVRV